MRSGKDLKKYYMCTFNTKNENQGLNLNRADEDSGGTDGPFCIRGGNYENGSQAGAFAFGDNNGNAWNNYAYRVVLVCEQHFDASKNQGLNLNRADEDSGSEGFCIRGGNYWNGTEAGAFAFADNDGNANNNYGYRVVLVCEQHFDANKNQGLNLKRAD